MLSLLDMLNDYFVTDKFFKTIGRICFLAKKRGCDHLLGSSHFTSHFKKITTIAQFHQDLLAIERSNDHERMQSI